VCPASLTRSATLIRLPRSGSAPARKRQRCPVEFVLLGYPVLDSPPLPEADEGGDDPGAEPGAGPPG
jgi:hypothetical protein